MTEIYQRRDWAMIGGRQFMFATLPTYGEHKIEVRQVTPTPEQIEIAESDAAAFSTSCRAIVSLLAEDQSLITQFDLEPLFDLVVDPRLIDFTRVRYVHVVKHHMAAEHSGVFTMGHVLAED